MIAISKPYIGKEEKKAVLAVLDSNMLAQGANVAKLEEEFCRLCGTKHAIAVNNGTAALHTALYTLNLQPGDEVITTPFTFVASANAILMAGGTPVFADIEPHTFNLDPQKIEKLINKKTKAILVVNLYGQPADYGAIKKIAKKYRLKIVEDAAQSIGAQYGSKKSGNLGDIGCFSLYATKNIMCGEGGVITTNSGAVANAARRFRHHNQIPGKSYQYKGVGYNYRLTDLAASIALVQLSRLENLTKKRQKIAEKYDRAFGKIKGLVIPYRARGCTHVFHQYTLRVTKKFPLTRDELKQVLNRKGVAANIYYPEPLQKVYHLRGSKKRNGSEFKEVNRAVKEVISIPCHPMLTNTEINQVIKTVLSTTTGRRNI